MASLVIAEHDGQQLKSSTLATIRAAMAVSEEVHVLIAGQRCQAPAKLAAGLEGVKKVLIVEHACFEHPLAENWAALCVTLADGYDHILAPATTFGKNILPRAAALLDVQPISDIIEVLAPDTFKRPIYAGNAIATVQSSDAKKLMTVRPTAFAAVGTSQSSAEIETLDKICDLGSSTFVAMEETKLDRPELTAARVVISGGRGLQNGENFKMLETLADLLNAAIGASRAAVDAGFVPNDYQVGQTGKIVAPDLYIAIGISGAVQHLAGMKDSKVIVAINKDEEAPIFQIADYGLVGDLFEIVPALTERLKQVMAS